MHEHVSELLDDGFHGISPFVSHVQRGCLEEETTFACLVHLESVKRQERAVRVTNDLYKSSDLGLEHARARGRERQEEEPSSVRNVSHMVCERSVHRALQEMG